MIEIDLDKISKNELATILIEKDKEIERLNKERSKTYENGLNYFLELQEKNEEIERLNNIINEVREYINRELLIKYKQDFELIEISHINKILEILDKGE